MRIRLMADKQIPLFKQIRAKRQEKNISMEALSKACGLSVNTIEKLETGRNTNITLATLGRISKALEYDQWDLSLLKDFN